METTTRTLKEQAVEILNDVDDLGYSNPYYEFQEVIEGEYKKEQYFSFEKFNWEFDSSGKCILKRNLIIISMQKELITPKIAQIEIIYLNNMLKEKN